MGGIQKSPLHAELGGRVYASTGRWIEGCVGKRGKENEWKGDTQGFERALKELKRIIRREGKGRLEGGHCWNLMRDPEVKYRRQSEALA